MLILLLDHVELAGQVLHAVVSLLFECPVSAHERAGGALKNDGRTLVLVREQFLIRQHLGAALLMVTALEHEFA